MHGKIDRVGDKAKVVRSLVQPLCQGHVSTRLDEHCRPEYDLIKVAAAIRRFHHGARGLIRILQHDDAGFGAKV